MTPTRPAHKPFVPPNVQMKEFTLRAVLLGLVMCVVLGAANAYLGLRAGQTIAATYPAAVIGMAVLRIFKGSILEENIARTAGSIGESVAAGAIFTIPAFIISRSWLDFSPGTAYWKSTSLDARRQRARRSVRIARTPRPGRRSRAPVPRIRRRLPDPQSRTGRRAGRQVSLLQHGLRLRRFPRGRIQPLRHRQRLGLPRRPAWKERPAPRRSGLDETCSPPAARPSSPGLPSARLTSASAT